MTRRQFRRLTSSAGPTLESLTRRRPSRRVFKDINGCLTIPPVPYPGFITRYMLPEAIEDTEELQTAADWSTGTYKTHWARQPGSPYGVEFIGDDAALYVYTLEVPSGTGQTTVITQPLRWTICEPTTSGGDFEMLKEVGPIYSPGSYEAGATTTTRSTTQGFAQHTWLPVSGNSHTDDSDPYAADLRFSVNACEIHVVHVNGEVVSTNPYAQRKPARWYTMGRYIRWRVNGVAVGPLHDLYDFYAAQAPLGTLNSAIPLTHLFPSGHFLWASFGHLLENWNLEFDAGDTLELDVWCEVSATQTTAGDRKLCVSVFRYYTDDNQQYLSPTTPTPTSGYSLRGTTGGEPWAAMLTLRGMNMSAGFDPALHTYDFNPSDGTIAMGKAKADGSIRFTVTSKKLNWEWTEAAGSTCGGTSTWQVQEIEAALQWVPISDDCEGGGTPVEPTSDPSEAGLEETTSCDCSSAGSGDTWTMALELVYEFEIVHLKVTYTRTTGTPRSAILWYRPESTGDYVENVTDRWEGEMKCGPTGVFDHLGTTTFRIWHGVKQTSGAYPTSLPSVYSALTGILPTEIVVTKVAQ